MGRRQILRRLVAGALAGPAGLAACAGQPPRGQVAAVSTAVPSPTLQPAAVSLLPSDPLAAFRLGGAAARDARVETVSVTPAAGVPFDQALRVRTSQRPPLEYSIQLTARTVAPVEKDDVILATFFIRSVEATAETGEGRTAIIFEQASDPYTKSLSLQAGAGQDWRRIDVPFKAAARYGAGQAQINFQVGFDPQVVDIGGVSLVNYRKLVQIEDLPRTRPTYAGREANAAWRRAAAERIETLRKADLAVTVRDARGRPVPGASVAVSMRRHAFGFGSAVAAAQIVGQDQDSQRYRETITRLFSKVVLENDLKWPNWEDQGQRDRTLRALQWLREQALAVRGHNLVWPSWRNLPKDLPALRADPAALRRRVQEHIVDEAGTLAGQLVDWDVVNEPDLNHDVMDVLGGEAMVDWFTLARQADPVPQLLLNEATAPVAGQRTDHLEQTVRFLLERGAPLDGVGFQCHFGMAVPAPAEILRGLDRFAPLVRTIQVTEFDIDTTDEALQADFTRDFLTAAFSHPTVDSIVMWGFWEGRHWRPDAALFRRNWAVKPNGQAWLDLVRKEWWTEAQGETGPDGAYRTRGFLGDYEVQVRAGEASKTVQASLGQGGATAEVTLD